MPNTRGDMQYRGMSNHTRHRQDGEYVRVGGSMVRKLNPRELREWQERLTGVVKLNTARRAVV